MNDNKLNDFLKGANEVQERLNDYAKTANEFAKKAQEQATNYQNTINANKATLQDVLNLKNTINNNDIYPQNTYSTTQFFDGSLSRDAFVKEGNSIDWYFKTYARKVRGLQNQGLEAYANNNNVLNSNGEGIQNVNGFSGVGFGTQITSGILAQKWWAWWVIQLATIQKLSGLVEFKTQDVYLLVQLYRAYQLAILCQASVIEKVNDKYRIWCAYDVKYDEFQQPKTCKISNADWFFTNADIPKDDDDKEVDLTNNKYCYLQWDLNNYNVWFYTVFYTIDYIDMLFIWLNRTYISRPIIFQQVGSSEASIAEAEQLINPMKTIIQVRTSGLEQALDNIKKETQTSFSIENKYQYQQIGDAAADSIFSSFPKIWINIWDSILGIVPPNNKLDAARSITDEVVPNQTINQILQKKYGLTLDLFVKEVKDKWNIDVSYELVFKEHEKEQQATAQKEEQGNPQEQEKENAYND